MDFLHTNDISKLKQILDIYGVAILDNYFDVQYADFIFEETKKWLINLNIGLDNNIESWTFNNTPIGPRYGMYHSIISNCPMFWNLRKNIYYIFAYLLNCNELLTSIDGASFYPAIMSPLRSKDWAHIDQTINSEFMCYQSQFVTTDTTAAFVATIGSHLRHQEILNNCDIKNYNSNWHKFSPQEVIKLKKMFGNNYQTPIHAEKGSIIFWDSRTIHSSKYPDTSDQSWRGVFYVSMRPKNTFTQRNINTITKAAINGRTTNHWGNKMFATKNRFDIKNKKIKNLMENLHTITYIWKMNDLQKKLIGLIDY